MLTLLNGGITL